MSLVTTKRRANTFFVIAQPKVLKAGEVCVTTVKGRSHGKNINQRITRLIWQLPWHRALTEEQYREVQELEDFDTKTSSWGKTPPDIRDLGGALFADRRYGKGFVYHNSAPSYYGARAFRASLTV